MKIRVLIVDDYNIFRSGLKLLIESEDKFDVIGEALTPDDLFKQLQSDQPDVIILNLMLPQKDILSITKNLHKKYRDIPFILLTVGAVEFLILECVINGARGILWKESTKKQLHESIETVVSGERFLEIPESKITSKIIHHANNSDSSDHDFSELSDREHEVLIMFAEGYSYKAIAEQL